MTTLENILDVFDNVFDILLASKDDKPLGISNEYYSINERYLKEEVLLFRPLEGSMSGNGIKVYLVKTLKELEKKS